ncbi:ankyrin repeat domain-containing protein [Wolbachia endosymbiont of Anurida maritima]|uniref:ankyrin repeat domain-containing protein n=1 Tax=Wolbachia endosymbiont of Anurida maritima TaxID=2850562 RepID=UPI0035D03FDB
MKQQPIRDTVDEVCTAVNSFIYDIIAANQKDDARKLLSLALKVRKFSSNANLVGFVNTLRKHITGELIDKFIEQLIEEYTTEEQRKAFIQEVCEIVLDPFPVLRVAEKFSQILNKEHVTEEYSNTSLHLAAEQGNLDAVKYFVEKGGDVSAQDEIGYTPLHLAAKQGNLDIIKYLVEKGADVDVYQGGWGYSTPLHLAAANGHLDTVKYLMGKGANPNAIDGDGKTPLQRANEKGISDIVEYLVERVQQVTEVPQITEVPQVTENYSNTSLHLVAEHDNIWVYLSNTAEVRLDNGNDTPLHLAALRGEVENVKVLVKRGDDVNAKNKYNITPLHVAAISGNLEIAQFLLNHDANINAQAVNGLTPLNIATLRNYLAMVKLLLDHCADVNIREGESYARYNFGYGRTPLISAVVACNTEIAKLLLDNGADVSIKGRGLTALDFANNNKDKCPEMLTLLKDGNIKSSYSRSHCTFTVATSSAARTSSFINGIFDWIKNILPKNTVALFNSQQSKSSRSRRDLESNSWTNNSIVNWVKSFLPSSTESPALLTSTGHDNTTVTAVPEINTTVVNNTIMLGILTAGLFYKTKYKQPIHENLLSPREQSMRLNNIDENMIIRSIQQAEEDLRDPNTDMDEVKISGNKTGMWK